MRTVVADTSCMIDLRKAGLLNALLRLPCNFVMPDVLLEEEWRDLSDQERTALRQAGLRTRQPVGETALEAQHYSNMYPRLTPNDCHALVFAEKIKDSILMTGDGDLRRIAGRHGLEVRGVLWVIDELDRHNIVSPRDLIEALLLYQRDKSVFLPGNEITKRINRLARKAESRHIVRPPKP